MNNQPAITRHPSLDLDHARQQRLKHRTSTAGILLVGLLGGFLWLSLALIVNLDGFFDRHDFELRTPLLLQAPLLIKATASSKGRPLKHRPRRHLTRRSPRSWAA